VRLLLAIPDSAVQARIRAAATAWDPTVACADATDARDALAQARGERWDLVLVGAKLGANDGLPLGDAVTRIRKVASNVPVVVITGEMSACEVVEATRAGATAYVDVKSMDPVLTLLERFDPRTPSHAVRRRSTGGPILATVREIHADLASGLLRDDPQPRI
jgi:DNA-binding response OmpR family regulator